MQKRKFISVIAGTILYYSGFAQQSNAFPLRTKIWKQSEISVCWDNMTDENIIERGWVKKAVEDTWQKYSKLKFTFWGSAKEKDADVHIHISDEIPSTMRLGNQIQHKEKGVILNFTFNSWSPQCKQDREFCIKAIAVHEFGHVLGFAHEQNKLECKFDDCFEEPQGEDGDWHMNQCDSNSIMNYCNKAWNNRGLLSFQDIKALQYFYQSPGSQSSLFQGFELIHNSRITNRKNLGKQKINHQINVFLVADSAKLNDVQKVVYFLDDDSFKNPVVTIRNVESNFGLGLRVWGEFMLVAMVFTKSGDIQLLKRYLKFDDNESVALQK